MTRPRMLLPALAIAALLMVAPVAEAAAVDIELELDANNGLHAQVANYEQITLEIERKGRFVTYEVPGEVTESGLKVQFGQLGLIDVSFQPTETRTDPPPKGCRGKPSALSEGVFVGTIQFTGERDYVRIDASQAEGSLNIWRESDWVCARNRRPAVPPDAPSATPSSGERNVRRDQASLIASERRCFCYFAAYAGRDRKGDGWTTFVGAGFEEREGMEITRGTLTNAGPASFVFDHDAGTARVDPPQPFTGAATFKRRPGRDLWRSTLRIPLLGTAPFEISGRDAAAALIRSIPAGR